MLSMAIARVADKNSGLSSTAFGSSMDCFGFRASVKARNLLSRGYAIAEMKALLARAHLIDSPDSEVFAWRFAAIAVFFALLWLEVINHLKGEWSFNPQYAYGWSVPFLAVYLFWKRWATRPAPAPSGQRLFAIALLF